MEEKTIKRYEVYIADLGECFGSRQGGIRPVLIVQNDIGNKYSPTTIVVPLTTKIKRNLNTHVLLNSLPKPSVAICEQIQTVDKEIIGEKICEITKDEGKKIKLALKISLNL